MSAVKCFAALAQNTPLVPHRIERRPLGPFDVSISIHFCGVCYSDLNKVRNVRGDALFPMVPGHEIAGIVHEIGSEVTRFRVGDRAGVGCLVDSCRSCAACREGLEPYCENRKVPTYNGFDVHSGGHTFGGYSSSIVVDQNFVFKIPANLKLEEAAPLLCAGSTSYAALKHWRVGRGQKVAVLGLGGLGHIAVKLAHALGAEVTVFSHSREKQTDALRFGASDFFDGSDGAVAALMKDRFELLLNTVSVPIEFDRYLQFLRRDGVLANLGMPSGASSFNPLHLLTKRRSIAGTLYSGNHDTQEMLNFCGENGIGCSVETIEAAEINAAFASLEAGKVRYRYVIDLKTL